MILRKGWIDISIIRRIISEYSSPHRSLRWRKYYCWSFLWAKLLSKPHHQHQRTRMKKKNSRMICCQHSTCFSEIITSKKVTIPLFFNLQTLLLVASLMKTVIIYTHCRLFKRGSDNMQSSLTLVSLSLVSWPTRWSLYLPLALCIDHLSILTTERRGTAIY